MGTSRKKLYIVFGVLLICAIAAGGYLFWRHSLPPEPEPLSAERATVAQIKTFTEETKEDNGYHYSYTCTGADYDTMEKWSIYFVEDNSFVRFYDQDLYDKIEALFGADTVKEGRAIYVYPEDRYSIYFKDEVMDGISIISYFPDDNRLEEIRLREEQEVSAELKQALEESGIFEQMEKDNAEVNAKLEENGIDVTQFKTIIAADCEPVSDQKEIGIMIPISSFSDINYCFAMET